MNAATRTAGSRRAAADLPWALAAEALLVGVAVAVLSIPLVTMPAAFSAGVRHLHAVHVGIEHSVTAMIADFRRILSRSFLACALMTAALVAPALSLAISTAGDVPGATVVVASLLVIELLVVTTLMRCLGVAALVGDGLITRDAVMAGIERHWEDRPGAGLLAGAALVSVAVSWMLAPMAVVGPGLMCYAVLAVERRTRKEPGVCDAVRKGDARR